MSTLLIPGFDTLKLYQGGGFADGGFQIALVCLLGCQLSNQHVRGFIFPGDNRKKTNAGTSRLNETECYGN